uniref:Uncharacterized protein n=1 Tax=Ditylenchus dipsaci TaxID=166011 RepID=A0A915E4F7_9BILA
MWSVLILAVKRQTLPGPITCRTTEDRSKALRVDLDQRGQIGAVKSGFGSLKVDIHSNYTKTGLKQCCALVLVFVSSSYYEDEDEVRAYPKTRYEDEDEVRGSKNYKYEDEEEDEGKDEDGETKDKDDSSYLAFFN